MACGAGFVRAGGEQFKTTILTWLKSQPRIRDESMSITKTAYSQPYQVKAYVQPLFPHSGNHLQALVIQGNLLNSIREPLTTP